MFRSGLFSVIAKWVQSCDTAKHESTDGQFLKETWRIPANGLRLDFYSIASWRGPIKTDASF